MKTQNNKTCYTLDVIMLYTSNTVSNTINNSVFPLVKFLHFVQNIIIISSLCVKRTTEMNSPKSNCLDCIIYVYFVYPTLFTLENDDDLFVVAIATAAGFFF